MITSRELIVEWIERANDAANIAAGIALSSMKPSDAALRDEAFREVERAKTALVEFDQVDARQMAESRLAFAKDQFGEATRAALVRDSDAPALLDEQVKLARAQLEAAHQQLRNL